MQVDWALTRRGVVMLVAGSRGGGLDGLQRALGRMQLQMQDWIKEISAGWMPMFLSLRENGCALAHLRENKQLP